MVTVRTDVILIVVVQCFWPSRSVLPGNMRLRSKPNHLHLRFVECQRFKKKIFKYHLYYSGMLKKILSREERDKERETHNDRYCK